MKPEFPGDQIHNLIFVLSLTPRARTGYIDKSADDLDPGLTCSVTLSPTGAINIDARMTPIISSPRELNSPNVAI